MKCIYLHRKKVRKIRASTHPQSLCGKPCAQASPFGSWWKLSEMNYALGALQVMECMLLKATVGPWALPFPLFASYSWCEEFHPTFYFPHCALRHHKLPTVRPVID